MTDTVGEKNMSDKERLMKFELNLACEKLRTAIKKANPNDFKKVRRDIESIGLAVRACDCDITRRQYLSREYYNTHY